MAAKDSARKRLPEARARKNEARRNDPDAKSKRFRNNVSRYGLTVEQYEAMMTDQDGKCAICGDRPDPDGRRAYSRLHIDHCHESGTVRKLLCGRCNQGLGFFRDNPDALLAAATYLKEHS